MLIDAQKKPYLVIEPRRTPTRFFNPIENILQYDIKDEPKCFRKGFKPLGVDFGSVPPYKDSKRPGISIPQSWKNAFKKLAQRQKGGSNT